MTVRVLQILNYYKNKVYRKALLQYFIAKTLPSMQPKQGRTACAPVHRDGMSSGPQRQPVTALADAP